MMIKNVPSVFVKKIGLYLLSLCNSLTFLEDYGLFTHFSILFFFLR